MFVCSRSLWQKNEWNERRLTTLELILHLSDLMFSFYFSTVENDDDVAVACVHAKWMARLIAFSILDEECEMISSLHDIYCCWMNKKFTSLDQLPKYEKCRQKQKIILSYFCCGTFSVTCQRAIRITVCVHGETYSRHNHSINARPTKTTQCFRRFEVKNNDIWCWHKNHQSKYTFKTRYHFCRWKNIAITNFYTCHRTFGVNFGLFRWLVFAYIATNRRKKTVDCCFTTTLFFGYICVYHSSNAEMNALKALQIAQIVLAFEHLLIFQCANGNCQWIFQWKISMSKSNWWARVKIIMRKDQ